MHSNLDLITNASSQLHGNWLRASFVVATAYSIPIAVIWTMVSHNLRRFSDLGQGMATLLILWLLLLAGPLMLGTAHFFMATARGQHPGYTTVFRGFRDMWRSLSTFLLVLGVTVLGYALFVIPGIIAKVGLGMAFFVLADNPNASSQQALSGSWALVWKQSKWWKFFFLLLSWTVLLAIGAALLAYLSPYVVDALSYLHLSANEMDTTGVLWVLLFLWVCPLVWTSVAALYDDLVTAYAAQPDRGTEAQALLGARGTRVPPQV